jgi:histidine ammonia-lyase
MIELSATGLTVAEIVAVARDNTGVELTGEARDAMTESAAIVKRLASSAEPAYGVSTGFGSLATTPIPAARREELQRALIRSHAAGMGDPI